MAPLKIILVAAMAALLCATSIPASAAQKKRTNNVQSLLIKRQYKTALDQLQFNAKAGSVKAQLQLGHLYRLGLGVPADLKKAAFWYGKAATGGNAMAKKVLKRMAVQIPDTEKQLGLRGSATPAAGSPDFGLLADRKVQGQGWLVLAAARHLPAVIDAIAKQQEEVFTEEAGQALLAAARTGDMVAIAALLKKGANPNSKDGAGQTATMIAASYGNVDALKALVAATPDLFARDDKGMGALGKAGNDCNEDAFKLLLGAGAKDKDPPKPVLKVVLQNCEHPANYFKDVRVNALNATDEHGRSVLWYAAERLDAPVLNSLLTVGADPVQADQIGYTPLHAAALGRRVDNIIVLLNAGAEPKTQTKNGITALMMAAYVGCVDCVRKLLNDASAIDVKDATGNSALMYSVLGKQKATADALIALGANPNAQNESGDTPKKLWKRISAEWGKR